jgi:hypothetical protein
LLPCAVFLPHQRFDLSIIVSSPRKFAECLYCDVSPPPNLPVVSCLIEFTCHVQFIQSYKLHSYIHTLILSRIHTFIYTQHIHNIIHTWLHQSPIVLVGRIPSVRSSLTIWSRLITCQYLFRLYPFSRS